MESNSNPERRQEPRSPQSGAIRISFDDPNPITVEAALIEVSGRGFRAEHDSRLLVPGLEVHYAGDGMRGRARVIWSHVLEGRCVSGFLILESAA